MNDEQIISEYPTLQEYFQYSGSIGGEERVIRPFHDEIMNAMTGLILGTLPKGKKKLAINMPPGHGKTFLTQAFVEWTFGMFPESRYIYASYSSDLAKESTFNMANNMRAIWYESVFPRCKLNAAFTQREYFKSTAGGYVKGVGLGGTILGFRAGRIQREDNRGFSGALIIDDPLKAKDAFSEVEKAKAVSTYYGTVKSRAGSAETPTIAIGQRLAPDDFFGRVFDKEGDQWHIVKFPGLGKDGKALWPEMRSEQDYILQRDVDEFTFQAQSQQEPSVPGGNLIKRDWWKYFDADQYNTDGMLIMTVDTAMKKNDYNDRSSLQLWNLSCDTLDFIEEVTGKWEFPELIKQMVEFYKKWANMCERQGINEPVIYVEDKASGAPMAQQLGSMGIKCRLWKPKDYQFPEDKLHRVKMSLFYIQAGRVRIPKVSVENSTWVLPFIEQCANFTGLTEEEDDSVDTMTMAVSVWRKLGGGADVKIVDIL
jgi:predicted phage terminase large subunit-like protein